MKALILVDIQNDFTPGIPATPASDSKPDGALAVPDGNAVIVVANRLMPDYDLVVATQDYHPAGHKSFASSHHGRRVGDVISLNGTDQILWPDHCVQSTKGSHLCDSLHREGIDQIVVKGTDPEIDSYSGFCDNDRRSSTGLADLLRACGVASVDIMGLATEYCVKFTALDAVAEGFETRLILDGCRGVDLQRGDVDRAIDEMRDAGVSVIRCAATDIRYVTGDATDPIGSGPRVIAHVCNDVGGWGRGFVLAVSKRWDAPEAAYRRWASQADDSFALGRVQFVDVGEDRWVANMIGQRDHKTLDGVPPVRYDAIRACLREVRRHCERHQATVHMPRIGCGLAGGRWRDVEAIVAEELTAHGIAVTVYDLPNEKNTIPWRA
jgi:nicotinamidase/pyrazinamidase